MAQKQAEKPTGSAEQCLDMIALHHSLRFMKQLQLQLTAYLTSVLHNFHPIPAKRSTVAWLDAWNPSTHEQKPVPPHYYLFFPNMDKEQTGNYTVINFITVLLPAIRAFLYTFRAPASYWGSDYDFVHVAAVVVNAKAEIVFADSDTSHSIWHP